MLARLKIGTKLTLAFAAVFVLVLALSIVSDLQAGRLGEIISNYGARKLPGTSALWQMREAESAARAHASVLSNPLLQGQLREGAKQQLQEALDRFAQAEKTYAALPHGARTTALLKEYQPRAEQWVREVAAFREAVKQRAIAAEMEDGRGNELDQKLAASYARMASVSTTVAESIQQLVQQTATDAAGLRTEAEGTVRSVRVTLWGATAVIGALLVGASLLLVRSIGANLRGLRAEAARLETSVRAGALDVRGESAAVASEFRPVVEGFNHVLEAFVKPIRVTSEYVDRISKGDLPPKIADEYQGDFGLVKDNLNTCIDAVQALVRDADALARSAIAGDLGARADATKHRGDFAKVVEGFNATLDAVVKPIEDAAQALGRLAQRDLRVRVENAYQGDHARIAEALNATAEALHDAMAQVAEAVQQVSGASGQIASSSAAVASGASEQASALEETGSSLETVASATRHAADSAHEASGLAATAKNAASAGSEAMDQMSGAMQRIKASAEGTSQIIKDINEIAFQTNLLALNAAVEAARAGEAGRGFAVVAEEVRSLALRSKEAASKTEDLIRQSVKEANDGEGTAKRVHEKLAEILAAVSKVTDIAVEVAAAAREQSAGIEQVNRAVAQMNAVTQQNAASSEETSSAAVELSSQSEQLAAMVATFELDAGSRKRQPQRPTTTHRAALPVRGAAAEILEEVHVPGTPAEPPARA